MNWKNLSIASAAGAVLLASAPAFADPPRWAPAYGQREHAYHHERDRRYRQDRGRDHYRRHANGHLVVVIHERPRRIVEHRVLVERAPLAAYGPAPVAYQPPRYAAPAYPASYDASGWGTVGGALTGALLGSRFGEGNGRVASIAVGSVVGAYVGNQIASGR